MIQPLNALFYPNAEFDSLMIPAIFREIYQQRLYDNIPINKESVMVDLGANIGLVTQYFKDKVKIIYAVEPAKEHFTALKQNKEYNHWDNVEIFNLAISDKDGEANLYHNINNHTSHSLIQNNQQGQEVVKTMRLDTFFEENNIEKVDFLKFDVEGAENIIIRDESFAKVAKKIQYILIEFHSYENWEKKENLKDLMKYLKRLGFHLQGWKMAWIAFYSR